MKQTLPGLVVFLGSFLVFGVQPVMGRTLLPLFGGIATVWVVCLAVFQTLSLAGYSYAHLLSRASVPDAAAKKLQGALLALSLLLTVALVGLRGRLAAWAGGSPYPVLQEVALICAFVGLPYVLLSANGILVQAWLSRFREQKVYRLYAVSNAGSFCGLLVYPFVLEPWVSLTAQWAGFAVLLALYTALLFFLPHDRGGAPPPGRDGAARGAGRLGLGVRVLWVALPASSCFVLNAVTTHLSEEILPIPLLWIALLALFLLSYVFGFSKKGEGAVEWLCVLTLIPLFGCAHALGGQDANTGFVKNLAFGLLLVLLGSTFIHSWLCRLRPHVGELTAFYMSLSAGGAAGGILAGVVAPVLFKTVFEYPLSLMLVGLLACCFARSRPPAESGRRMALGVYGGVLVCLAVAMAGLLSPAKGRRVLQRARNFYACMRVEKAEFVSDYGEVVESHHLMHGNVTHGYQFLPHYLRKKPTAYFGPHGGGFGITSHPAYPGGSPMRVAVIGLGVGTLAAWGRANDYYRMYEINPQVVSLARDTNYFSYLSDCQAAVDIVTADARAALEKERAGGEAPYDVIVVDAYNGDAVPIHLITQEAYQLLFDRLAAGGILAVHVSSWHFNLFPVCKAVARKFRKECTGVISGGEPLCQPASWVMICDRRLPTEGMPVREVDWERVEDIDLPLDEKGSLLGLVRYNAQPPLKSRAVDVERLFKPAH